MIEINICVGSSCHLKGSYNVIQEFQQIIENEGWHEQVSITATFCMKQCQDGVSVAYDERHFSLRPGECGDFVAKHVVPKMAEHKQAEKKTKKTKRDGKGATPAEKKAGAGRR